MSKKQKPTLNSNYDLSGNSITRMMRHWLRVKTSIMGNYDTGPGLRSMLTLWLLHRFGKPLFAVRTWLNNQYDLKARVKSLVRRAGNQQRRANQEVDD